MKMNVDNMQLAAQFFPLGMAIIKPNDIRCKGSERRIEDCSADKSPLSAFLCRDSASTYVYKSKQSECHTIMQFNYPLFDIYRWSCS
jgi:hypothetical protein